MDWSRRIDTLGILVHCFVIASIKCFVSQRPDNDRSVILVSLYHLNHPINVSSFPLSIVRCKLSSLAKNQLLPLVVVHLFWDIQRPSNSIIESMAFEISLVQNP